MRSSCRAENLLLNFYSYLSYFLPNQPQTVECQATVNFHKLAFQGGNDG